MVKNGKIDPRLSSSFVIGFDIYEIYNMKDNLIFLLETLGFFFSAIHLLHGMDEKKTVDL